MIRKQLTLCLCVGALSLAALTSCSRSSDDAPSFDRDQLEAVAQTSLRIGTATIVREQLGTEDALAGVVSPFREAVVSAEAASRVVAREVEPGAQVAEGDVLVQLDASRMLLAVEQARATLEARSVDFAEAKRELERGSELRGSNAMSAQRYDSLRFGVDRARSAHALAKASLGSAARALEDATIRAPFRGRVESVAVDVGDYLAPGTPIARIVDLERVRIRAGVSASEADAMHEGGRALVTASTLGGRARTGTIQSIGRVSDRSTGVFPVEVWVDNADAKLRGGMVATLRTTQRDEEPTLIAPSQALARRGNGVAVFVVEARGDELRAYARPVRLGRRNRDRVEILAGVEAGDRVVTDGHFALADGARVELDAEPTTKPVAAGGAATPGNGAADAPAHRVAPAPTAQDAPARG